LLFGVYYHYIASGPDHMSQIPEGTWGMVFHLTAALLVVVEGLGSAVGLWGMRSQTSEFN
jgi:hypothetical protein